MCIGTLLNRNSGTHSYLIKKEFIRAQLINQYYYGERRRIPANHLIIPLAEQLKKDKKIKQPARPHL